jgi:alpha-1,3-mannosyltransferase
VHKGKSNDERNNECYISEPTLFYKDIWYKGFGRIAVVPSVNMRYDDKKSIKMKRTYERTEEWIEREKRNKDALIK